MALHLSNSLSPNTVNLFVEEASKNLADDELFQLYAPFKVFRVIIDEAYKMQTGSSIAIPSTFSISSDNITLYSEGSSIDKSNILSELVRILPIYKDVSVSYPSTLNVVEAEAILPLSALVIIVHFLQAAMYGDYKNASEPFLHNTYLSDFYALYNAVHGNLQDIYNTTQTLKSLLKKIKFVDGKHIGEDDLLFAVREFHLLKGSLVKINEGKEWNQNVVNLPNLNNCAFKVSYSPGVYMKNPKTMINPEFDDGSSSLRVIIDLISALKP